MTIADVYEFYQRRDILEATGDEEPCHGCDKQLEADEPFSHYDLKNALRTPKAYPATIVLCQKCAYLVIAFRPPPPAV